MKRADFSALALLAACGTPQEQCIAATPATCAPSTG